MLDPRAGRARIEQHGEKMIISIKGKRNLFVGAILGFWLIGWAFGWVAATGGLLFGGAGIAKLFLLVWLGLWTTGGVFTFSIFLWFVAGRETVEISGHAVTITRHLPVWSKTVKCQFSELSGLRAEEAKTSFSMVQMPNWYSRKAGNIQLDYGVHSIGFGIDLDQAEARQIISTILSVFPEIGTDAPRSNT